MARSAKSLLRSIGRSIDLSSNQYQKSPIVQQIRENRRNPAFADMRAAQKDSRRMANDMTKALRAVINREK